MSGSENSYLIDLSNFMVVLNSSCNFVIYYVFGAQFRATLRRSAAEFRLRASRQLKYSSVEADFFHEALGRAAALPAEVPLPVTASAPQPAPSPAHALSCELYE